MKYRIKCDTSDYTRIAAICHMIGQNEHMLDVPVKTATIAGYMGVSKPTAIKMLRAMTDLGYTDLIIEQRKNGVSEYKWRLSETSWYKYSGSEFKASYDWYRSLIVQVWDQRGNGKVAI